MNLIKPMLGGLLLAGGLMLMVFGAVSTATPPNSNTLNLGLLVDKIVVTLIGCTFFLAGLLLVLDRKSDR